MLCGYLRSDTVRCGYLRSDAVPCVDTYDPMLCRVHGYLRSDADPVQPLLALAVLPVALAALLQRAARACADQQRQAAAREQQRNIDGLLRLVEAQLRQFSESS